MPAYPNILPIPFSDQLLPLLQRYALTLKPSALTSLAHPPVACRRHALSLLPLLSAEAQGLSEHEAYVLGDLCGSLKEVAEMAGAEDGKRILQEYLGEQVQGDIEAFWSEEWICD